MEPTQIDISDNSLPSAIPQVNDIAEFAPVTPFKQLTETGLARSEERSMESILDKIAARQTIKAPVVELSSNEQININRAIDAVAKQNDQEQSLNSAISIASKINPDSAAQAQQLGQKTGLGQDLVMRNMDEVKRKAQIQEIIDLNLPKHAPKLAQMFASDPEFASVAHTDASELLKLTENWKDVEVTGYPFVDYFIPAYTKQRLIGGFARGEIQAETKKFFLDTVKATTEEELIKIETQKFKNDKESEDIQPITSGFIAGPAYGVAQFINSAGNVWSAAWKGAVTAGGVAALFTGANPLAAVMAALGGGAIAGVLGFATDSFESNAGEFYFDLRKKGYDRHTAMLAANLGGTVMASIDVVSFGFASAFAGRALSKLIQNEVIARIATKPITEAVAAVAGAVVPKTAAALIKPSITRAVGQAAFESVKGTASEITGEMSQDAVQYLSETITYYLQSEENRKKLESPVGLQEFASQLVETAVQTMQMTLPLQLPGSMIHIYNTNKSIQQQKLRSKWMGNLKEKVDSIPLTKRSPITMQQFIAKSAEGTNASTVYIDGEELAGVLNQLQIPDEQIDSVLPGVRAQMKVAIETGGDVKISIGEYMTNVGKTPVLYNALEQHVKIGSESGLASGAVSAKQAIARQESMQQDIKDAQAEMAVQEKTNAQFVREAKEIERVVTDQLVAAGRPPTEAAFAAKLVQARAVTAAAAAGITPAQWVAQHPVPKMQSQQQAAQAAQQAPAKPFVPKVYQETTVTPEQTAHLSEPLAAAESELTKAKESNSITERGGKQINASLSKLKTALASGKLGEIGAQTWKLLERLKENSGMKAAAELAAKTLATLTKLGVEFYDPIGRVYTEGWVEVEVVSWLPYEEGVSKDQPFVERVISPVVRRNGQIIQRGQVQVREGRIAQEEYLAKQARDAEIAAKMQPELDALQAKLEEEGKTDEVVKQLVAERKAELEAKAREEWFGKQEQQAPAQQINVGDTITVYDLNGTPQQVAVIAKSSKGTLKIKLADGTEDFAGSGTTLTLNNPKDQFFVISGTELPSKPGVLDHSLSSLSNDEISLLIENRKNHLQDIEKSGNNVLGKDSAMTRWNQDLIALESEVVRRSAQGSLEQASRADLGLRKPVGKQVVNIETNEFKDWFAGSVATVTKDGYPIKLYRWARSPFVSPELDSVAGLAGQGSLLYGDGVTLTAEPMAALEFKGNPQDGSLLEVVTRIKNPLVIDAKGDSGFGIDAFNKAVAKLANISVAKLEAMAEKSLDKYNKFVTKTIRNAGHDGVHVKNAMQSDSGVMVDNWVPFNTEDIMTTNVATAQDAWNFEDAAPGQQDPNILRQEAVPATAMPSVTTANPVSPIGLAIASANLNGVKSVEESDTFFKKVWKKLLIASGKQMRSKSDESVKEAAKLAVADIQDFVKNNPQFSDYYSQDWMKTRLLLDEYAGRAITDDEFQMYRVICGLTSPNTQLPSNISDTVKLWTHWMENGSFDGFLLGPKPITGASVVFESDEVVSGTTANNKIRTVKIIAQLIKELGSVKAAIDFLREPVTGAELNKVNKSLGYAGNVSHIGNIRALVKMATGQDKLIPRMFIFGQKVGAYTLNAVGDERFTTVDIWESRYIRSFFSGMFENEIGLPTDEKEHDTFVRFGYAFKDEMERVTGRTWTPSSLQALRWFYIIAATRSAGYSKASTNETISTYTSRVLQKQFDYNQSRKLNATKSTTTPPRRIVPQKYERDISGDLDAKGITDPKQRREYTAQAWIQFARSNSESDPMGFQFDTNRSGVPRRSGPLKGLATVATHTPGSQLAKAFAKAGASIQPYVELAQTEVGAKAFSNRVRAINANSKFGTAVYVYSDAEYMGKRLFISESGKSGFALSSDGDIVSVFSEAGSREGRGAMALATQMGGTKLDCFDTVLPGYYAAHGFRAVARVKWSDEYTPAGWDFGAFAQFNGGRPDVVYMVYEANYFDSYSNTPEVKDKDGKVLTKAAVDGVVVADPSEAAVIQTQDIKVEQDRVAANKARYAEVIKPSQTLFQAAEGGARGEIDPVKNLITIKNANSLTVFHELMHWFVIDLFRTATDPAASALSKSDADILLKWFGIGGSNMQERIANWNAMTLEEQRRHHEATAYNAEIWVATGRAPSVELQGVFERFRRWATRAYKSIRDDLNEIYRQQFGTDLPFLTDEVRGVFDRMLASEEQISRREAIDNFKGMYQTQEESGMNDGEWAAMQAEIAKSHETSVTELLKETVKEMKWESNAKKGFFKKLQDAEDGFRKVIRSEESDKMGNEPVRKAERFFKTGKMVDPSGKEIEVVVGNKIDSVAVEGMYPTSTTGLAPAVDLTKLRGMTMEGGLAPDLAAEMFGFSSGDQLIRALAELKPFKDELKERTDARMLDEHGGMNTEAEKEEAVNKALANEVRARIVAIENRYLTKVKTPVAVIMQGAKELARTILGRMAIKDIKPRNYVATEARVAKDKHTAVKAMQSPETAGKSAYTRSFNEQIAAGVEESVAASEALVKSVEAIKRAQAKIDAHKKQYGDVDPAIVAAKASHQQVIQGQLAKEGYKILDEVDKALAYVKRIVSDVNRKNMGADHADQIEAILERFGLMGRYVAPTTRTPLATWAQTQQDIGFDIEIPDIVQESVRKNFLELTPEEFQDVIDTVKQIAHTGKAQQLVFTMDRKITFEKAKTEIVDSINENAGGRKAKTETASTNVGRSVEAIGAFFAAHLKAAIIVQIMDGGKEAGKLWNYLVRSANNAANKETTMRAAATKRISEILDPVFKNGKMGGSGVYFPSIDRSLNREQVLIVALNMGNEGNMQRLLDGRGWTIEQVMPIIQSLTAAELNAVQEIWDHSEIYKAEIIEMYRRTAGREPQMLEPKPLQVMSSDGQMVSLKGGYYPAKYDPKGSARTSTLTATEQALRDLRDARMASTTRNSYAKPRAKEVHDRPLLLNLSALYSGIGEVIHDLSWREWLIDANRLMRSSSFDKAVREQYGSDFLNQIKTWIKDIAAGDKGVTNAGEMVANFARQGISAAGLTFNFMSAAGQITGFAQSVIKVGVKWIGRGIAASVTDPKAAIERVYALSPFMANRGSTQFRELNEIKNMVQGESVAMKRVKAGGYFLMLQMQRVVDIPTWIGAYEKQLSINSDEKLAIAIADQAVIDSQGGGMLKDLSAIERGGPMQKLFTVFYSFMNTNLNLAVLKGMTEKNAGKWVAQQAMLWVAPVVTMYMLKKLLTPQTGDDDKWDLNEIAKELAAEELSFLMGSFMGIRELAPIAPIITGSKTYGTNYRGPAGLRMIDDTITLATQARQLEFDTAFRKAAINIIGDGAGLPSAQINRTIDGIEALMEGETENITAPLFGVKKR